MKYKIDIKNLVLILLIMMNMFLVYKVWSTNFYGTSVTAAVFFKNLLETIKSFLP